ncbi:MAG: T9SS type A sorting domain-containing protein [Candidatus Methylacidiphilales bacterium]
MKNKILTLLCLSAIYINSFAQLTYDTKSIKAPLSKVVNMSVNDEDFDPKLILLKSAAPKPATEFNLNKQALDKKHLENILKYNGTSAQTLSKTAVTPPTQLKGFRANITQGTPNDNDIAISNSGIICSVVNTNLNVINDTGRVLSSRTLSSIAKGITNLNRTYDPRVIYDPEADRFILVFMQGSTSRDTRIIVGFSQTNDPSQNWNFYTIPGNITGDSSWSDYPIIAITKNELFLTINRLKDNTYWKNGFIESYVWQMDKDNGFKGDSLNQKVYFNIKYNDKPIWSVCPAKGGSKLYGPNMNLFSVRPDQLWNDTVFVHEITNTIKSGKAELKTKLVVADNHYGLQPNAFQPNGKKLQTNDARVLSAMYENGIFYLVGNSVDARYNAAGFYLITIENYWGPNALSAKLQIISSDTMDFGYPSIAYCGNGLGDNSAMITCSHVSPRTFPGTSLVYVDRNLNPSIPAIMKAGESNVLLIGDSVERWGDYTGIQRKYNEPGKVFFNGSYGLNNDNRTWIGISKNADAKLNTKDINNEPISNVSVYPIPAKEYINIDFNLEQKTVLNFVLIDMQGKETLLLTDRAKAGLNRFIFNAANLQNGYYQLIIKDGETIVHSKKIMVTH